MNVLSDEAVSGSLPVRELWLEGATLEQLLQWVDATRALAGQHAGSSESLSASVRAHAHGLVVIGHAPDEGWLHVLALEAERHGVSSLCIDGEALGSTAPFFTFTRRQPGVAQHTLWFDPLRGLDGDEPALSTLLIEVSGQPTSFDEFLFGHGRTGELLGSVTGFEHGRALERAQWKPWVPWATRFAPSGLERLGSALVFVVPLVLTTLLWGGTQRSNSLGAAMAVAPLVLLLSGWLGFFPLLGPTGQVVPWWFRVPWFLAAPFATLALLFSFGATS